MHTDRFEYVNAELKMSVEETQASDRQYWFVSASPNKNNLTKSYIRTGEWLYRGGNELVKRQIRKIKQGDAIALKTVSVRNTDLPFDNRNHSVSVMKVSAVGTVKSNPGDGEHLYVDWERAFSGPREWFFYTNRGIVWQLQKDNWMANALIRFAFRDELQPIDRFRNDPYWHARFGDRNEATGELPSDKFQWTAFYSAVADKLRGYRNRRGELLDLLRSMAGDGMPMIALVDPPKKGNAEPLEDIDPFTFMASFNRTKMLPENRSAVARRIGQFFGIEIEPPTVFSAIPSLPPINSRFFESSDARDEMDINSLWDVFEAAIDFADDPCEETRTAFVKAYDNARERPWVKWNLTIGLFWIRPWQFETLDRQSRGYIRGILSESIKMSGSKRTVSAEEYLRLRDRLDTIFRDESNDVHSFPELSLEARRQKNNSEASDDNEEDADGEHPCSESSPGAVAGDVANEAESDELEAAQEQKLRDPYGVDNIVRDGCFLPREQLEDILSTLEKQKNIILQGPPGTGKTWLAKRLAYAHIGERDVERVRTVQFHANISYEDFVRGYRPNQEGRLDLVDGPLMEMIDAAKAEAEAEAGKKYVLIVEEINRGNPAHIFGEMLTLLEADKRLPSASLMPTHRRTPQERIYVPENLYLIGTMNMADRSLAQLDLALRRRFAFIDLEPAVDDAWLDFVTNQSGLEKGTAERIRQVINGINKVIEDDPALGRQFRLGHSYVTPGAGKVIESPKAWFRSIVKTQILPLLAEYWFDEPKKVEDAKNRFFAEFLSS